MGSREPIACLLSLEMHPNMETNGAAEICKGIRLSSLALPLKGLHTHHLG